MKRMTSILLGLLLATDLCHADFSASGGINNAPYAFTPAAATGLEKVYVFNGFQNARLTFSDDQPADWTWYTYMQDPAEAEAVPASQVEVSATGTSVLGIQAGHGYFVKSSAGIAYYVYVVAWIPVGYAGITFPDEGDPCSAATLNVSATGTDMYYYTASGLRRTLERQHTLTWNTKEWDATAKKYTVKEMTSTFTNVANNWSVEAPLTNTRFTVTGDQFSQFFGSNESLESDVYPAKAVKTSAEATVQVRTSENETGESTGALSGSAPMEVEFNSYPSDAVTLIEWFIYKPGDETTGMYSHYTDETITYSFKESGTYTVKLIVSNATCKDSATFNPVISVSKLDCPNFFTPRSTPGENDEFRVAYTSIVSFKGVIVNRWGNVLFEWTDPAKGWNGTFKGKPVSPGVYFYIIDAVGSDGIVYKKRGDINLLE